MLAINTSQANTIVVTLKEKQTLSDPYFLFVFHNEQEDRDYPVILTDISLYTRRYNEFILNDGVDVDLKAGDYEYFVYEQTSPINLDPSLADNLVETGKARVFGDVETEIFYTPTDVDDNIFDYPYLTNDIGQILTDGNGNTLIYG